VRRHMLHMVRPVPCRASPATIVDSNRLTIVIPPEHDKLGVASREPGTMEATLATIARCWHYHYYHHNHHNNKHHIRVVVVVVVVVVVGSPALPCPALPCPALPCPALPCRREPLAYTGGQPRPAALTRETYASLMGVGGPIPSSASSSGHREEGQHVAPAGCLPRLVDTISYPAAL
jgi:hypothetical protein